MSIQDYSNARWYGAHSNNYTAANRPDSSVIDKVIVHVTQGSWSSAINWFNNEDAGVSAHYTVRSDDGFIGQSVHEKDIGYHAGNWNYNKTSIGIEHEGYVDQPEWFTGAMYRSSAKLTAYLCKEYGIPIDRQHIIAHSEVPEATHTDPGEHWDWPRYMDLIRRYSRYVQIVSNANDERFSASDAWKTSSYSDQKHGGNYRYTEPVDSPDSARFRVKVPETGEYLVHAWWPASPGYSNRTLFRIYTADGWVGKVVNQQKNGGKWVSLGTHELEESDGWRIQVSNRSPDDGYIIADAVRIARKL